MDLIKNMEAYAKSIPAEFKEKKGSCELSFTVAERKAFLSKQKLTYQAKFRVDEKEKFVRFTELLKESSSGMESQGMSFSTTSFKTGKGGQQESLIEQQSDFFGKKYDYSFDFREIREKIEALAKEAGYDFQYQLTAKGL
ncbi:MAG TPA: hypothetical protein VMW28_06295 [Pelolinea sp.]|nr:hypothetical protein [Pelolinea sp.]